MAVGRFVAIPSENVGFGIWGCSHTPSLVVVRIGVMKKKDMMEMRLSG